MNEKELNELSQSLLKGNRVALGRGITLIESSNTEHRAAANQLIEACTPHSGNSLRIGITGVPGVGKSTFIESFGSYLIEKHRKKVAVLAIDPSSTKSKGSILGDKARMHSLSQNENAFIRPSPTSGSLGGVSMRTREAIVLCEAAGFDTILIETVGVGQSETEVSDMVDFFLLLMLAGAGDELQGMKRGIMEMADLVVIHKADGSNLNAAKKAMTDYRNALHLFPAKTSEWTARVAIASSIENTGQDEIWNSIEKYRELTTDNGFFQENRNNQALEWMKKVIEYSLKSDFYSRPLVAENLRTLKEEVLAGRLSPTNAANELISLYNKKN